MAIDRDIMRRRDVPMPSPDRQGQQIPRRFSVPPRQIPKGGPMPPPGMGPFRPMPTPMPMPMPMPAPRGLGPRGPMMPATPMPGMGPFRPQPFLDQMPRGREMGIMAANKMSMPFDDDDYGPFIPPSVIELDQFGTDYGPYDEFLFDKEKGFENRIFGIEPNYFRGGIASLLK